MSDAPHGAIIGRALRNLEGDAMSDDESLITPAMEAAIGAEGEAVTATVDADALKQLMEALEEDDQSLLDAVASGDASVPMPTYALLTMSRRQEQMSIPDAPSRALMASEAWTVSKPIHIGDELRIQPRIAEIQERIGGRVGHSLFVHHEWVYSNASSGEELARVRRTIAHFKEQHTGE